MKRPGDVQARALTLRGAPLASAIAKGKKTVENRHFKMTPGWYALHVGRKKCSPETRALCDEHAVAPLTDEQIEDMEGCIVGAFEVEGTMPLSDATADDTHRPWASGPVCNVIVRSVQFEAKDFIRGVKGKLGPWRMQDQHAAAFAHNMVKYRGEFTQTSISTSSPTG